MHVYEQAEFEFHLSYIHSAIFEIFSNFLFSFAYHHFLFSLPFSDILVLNELSGTVGIELLLICRFRLRVVGITGPKLQNIILSKSKIRTIC